MEQMNTDFQEDWKVALSSLYDIYSGNQLAVVLGLSCGSASNQLISRSNTSFKNKIFEIKRKLNKYSPQTIFFLEWYMRTIKNDRALTYRAIRQNLKLSNRQINFLKDSKMLANYENSANIMSRRLFDRILRCLSVNGLKYDHRGVNKYKLFVKNQISQFVDNKLYLRCPSLMRIIPPVETVSGIEKQREIFDKIKRKYPYTFMGCSLSKNLKRKDNVDILAIDNCDVIVFEVKDYETINRNTRVLLRNLNSHLRRLRRDYKEITKTIAILPSVEVSEELKELFIRNKNILLDKNNFGFFLNNRNLLTQEGIKKETNLLGDWLSYYGISTFMLDLLFEMNCIKSRSRGIYKDKYFKLAKKEIKFIELFISKYSKRRLHFIINKYAILRDKDMLFLKNLRKLMEVSLSNLCLEWFGDSSKNRNRLSKLETGKQGIRWLKEKYKQHLIPLANKEQIAKVESLIIEEENRWEIAEKFPMVVGLRNPKDNRFEVFIAKYLKNNGYKVISNAQINDKDLSKMTLNFQHPEADIIAKKNNSFSLISCKESTKRSHNTQFYQKLKSEIDRLFDYKEDIGFSKVVLVVKTDFSDKTWETLSDYARTYGVDIWRFSKNAF